MATFTGEEREGIFFLRVTFLESRAPVKAVYTSRRGGMSNAPYDGLNLGLHVGDNPRAVLANRNLLAGVLNLPLGSWVIGEQVHGNEVARVGREQAGSGVQELTTALKGIDALVTNEPGVTLVAFFADCVPIYIVDPVNRALGLAHAGWRGTVLQVGARMVARMATEFGSRPRDLLAAIGPAVGPCCYQVDARVVDKVQEHLPCAGELLAADGPGHWRLDLPRANYLTLVAAGLQPDRIAVAGICTHCQAETFFSHRASGGITGRQAAMLALGEQV
ncbi:peptidoglycan editing factor PgeF [Neomoorella thermoacetica]|uniref:peptidoglycan editing factor PgeF n=1 Tax=Neomoorella thermoacetica TaxID=1525 RepID=UPI0030D389C2